jgi:hypothetical protein
MQPDRDFAMVMMTNIAHDKVDSGLRALAEVLYRRYTPAWHPDRTQIQPSSRSARPVQARGRDASATGVFAGSPALRASRTLLAAVKASFLEAGISIVSPVAGLRPCRASRLDSLKRPKPLSATSSPVSTAETMAASTPGGIVHPSQDDSRMKFSRTMATPPWTEDVERRVCLTCHEASFGYHS